MSAIIGLTSGAGAEACMPAITNSQIALLGTTSGNMGIRAGSEVKYELVIPDGQTDPVAVLVQLQGRSPLREDKGRIIVIRDDGAGIVEDGKTGTQYSFEQPFAQELGLEEGDQIGVSVVPWNGSAVLTSLVNTSRSNIRGIVLSLGAGDATDVLSVEGGDRVPVAGIGAYRLGDRGLLVLRPETLSLTESAMARGPGIPGHVALRVFEGARHLYEIEIGASAPVRVELPVAGESRIFRLGDRVRIEVSSDTVVLVPST